MQLEVIRSVADWLAGATTGVNAEIDNLDLDAGDSAPPDVGTILDETRSAILALRKIPKEQAVPFLFVWFSGDAQLEAVNQGKQDSKAFEITIAYVDRDSNAANAVRDGAYVMRAVRRSLNRLHDNANVASRTRNQVIIRNGDVRMRLVRPSVELESAVISLGLAITYAVRDDDP